MEVYAFADEISPLLDEQIRVMNELKLDGVELRGIDHINVSDITCRKAKEVRKKMDSAELKINSIGSPIGKIDIEKDDFAKHVEKFRHTVEIANIVGAKRMRIFSFYLPKNADAEEYTNEIITRLGVLWEIAEKSGIILCHENEKGLYGERPERCLKIHHALPGIKAVFDPANFVQAGIDTKVAWELLKSYVDYLHIKDALPDGNVVPAGSGAGNLAYIVNEYQHMGGKQVTLEPHLRVFEGLEQLEQDSETKSGVGELRQYSSSREAFQAAMDAWNIIKRNLREVTKDD